MTFQTATDGIFKKMYNRVDTSAPNNPAAFERLMNGGHYAFIDDKTSQIRDIKDNCQLAMIGEQFFKSGFGLAFPEGWKYKKYFDAKWVIYIIIWHKWGIT